MDFDGTKKGFDLRLLQKISKALPVPIIASGGAGNTTHFSEVFTKTNVTGALAASIFHFGEIAIPALKQELQQQKIPVRWI